VDCKESNGTTDNGTPIIDGTTSTISADSNITCTSTNSEQRGSILVEKLQAGTTGVRIDGASFALDGDRDVESVTVGSDSTCEEAVAADPQVPDASFQSTKIPSIVTQASRPVAVGEDVTDTATLSGGYNPTGRSRSGRTRTMSA